MNLTNKFQGWDKPNPRNRQAGLAATLLLHAGAVIALLQYEPVRSALTEAAPIMISLITPQPVVDHPQQLPKPLPLKPSIQQPKPEPQQLVISVSDASALAPSPPPLRPATVESPPQPQPIAAAPVPVIPPNFNADYLDNPPPAYPALSRRLSEQGKVLLRVLVNRAGAADKIELKSSSGSSRLDDAALETVKHWRFVPARQGDQPVAAWVLVPITFTLKS